MVTRLLNSFTFKSCKIYVIYRWVDLCDIHKWVDLDSQKIKKKVYQYNIMSCIPAGSLLIKLPNLMRDC